VTDLETSDVGFFDSTQRRLIEVIVADIIPDDDGVPGAREAGVADFIDAALAGSEDRFRPLYVAALEGIDAHCQAVYSADYAECNPEQRVQVLEQLEVGTLDGNKDAWVTGFFFVLWVHTVEGYLCDPAYGGNKNLVGWRAVGFPGAHHGFTAEQQTYGRSAVDLPLLTLKDMEALHAAEPGRFFNSY
jgi:gluconate 2-dehydrogenase gamma chain